MNATHEDVKDNIHFAFDVSVIYTSPVQCKSKSTINPPNKLSYMTVSSEPSTVNEVVSGADSEKWKIAYR